MHLGAFMEVIVDLWIQFQFYHCKAGNVKLVPVGHTSQPGRRAADDPQVSTDRVYCSWAKSDFFFGVSCGQKIAKLVGTVGFSLL